METALSIFVGIGLSAACGFRVFVPFLLMSIAALSGHLSLAPGFEWIGTLYALLAFGTATVVEVLAYYVPWLDNLLDALATPLAIVAGTVATASIVGDLSPFLKWSLALVAGGGTASLIQLATVALRGTSTATTGGLGNPVVATGELLGSVITTILAIVLPVVAVILVGLTIFFVANRLRRLFFGKSRHRSMTEQDRF